MDYRPDVLLHGARLLGRIARTESRSTTGAGSENVAFPFRDLVFKPGVGTLQVWEFKGWDSDGRKAPVAMR